MNLETDNKIQKKEITLVIPNPCGNIKETKMKNSGIEWIGEIPEDWEVSKIGQLYEERKTKVSDTVYPPLSVTMQGILPQLETAAKSDAHDDRKLVLKGDFAINSRSDRRGSCGISEFDGSVSLINTVLHPKTEMNPIYYNWLFHSFRFSDEYYKNGHGIVDDLWTTSWTEMKKIFIPLPPKETQQRIATYLDKKCSKIEETIQNQQQVIEKLKAYKQSLITEAVTGKVKIENGKACGEYESYKDSGVEWIGKIPSGWISTRVGHLYKSMLGKMVCPNQLTEEHSLQKYLCAMNVHFDGVDLSEIKEMWFTSNEMNQYQVRNGDLLVVEGGAGAGGASIVYGISENDKIFIQNSIHLVKPVKTNYLPKYLYYWIYSLVKQNYIDYTCNKATIPHFTKEKLEGMPIAISDKITQQEIIVYLDKKCTAIDTTIEQKQKLIEKLTEYKKSLIYECVTGKKEI